MIVVLGIAALCVGQSDVLAAKASDVPYPIYESVGPDKRSRVLIEGNTLHFGGAEETAKSLAASDVGHSFVFEEVAGGIRARTQPILFPDGKRSRFEFDDFSCSVAYQAGSAAVSCISKLDGQRYRSFIKAGGLEEFEGRCFYVPGQTCRYRLISGRALRPSKVQPAS